MSANLNMLWTGITSDWNIESMAKSGAVGLANVALYKNAKIGWNWKNLSPTYYGGKVYDVIDSNLGGTGAYVPIGFSAVDKFMMSHEMRHVWQSRAMGDSSLFYNFANFFTWVHRIIMQIIL